MSISIPVVGSLMVAIICVIAAPADFVLAQIDRRIEFKIDTKMYVGDNQEAVFENKTIFSDGLIFDFPLAAGSTSPDEVLVYDSNLKTISLLDLKRQMQLRLLDVQLVKMIDGVREEMATGDRSRAMLDQKFKETIDTEKGLLTLIGDQKMTYQLHGTAPKSAKVLSAYFEFLDVFTRVQITDPKRLPPFARLRLNESIRRIGWIPDRVDITIGESDVFPEDFKARTEHKLTMTITDRDRTEIGLVKKNWAALPEVSLTKYRGLAQKKNFFERVAEGAKQEPAVPPAK